MKELSLNILDLVQNSITAGAKNISITVAENSAEDLMTISIKDDGCGMDPDFLSRVTDPFTTTRTSRKVGMGLPLMKMEAEMAGGYFHIDSEKEKAHTLRPDSSFLTLTARRWETWRAR
jgi:signal transduction histidine kinase